LKSHHAKVKKVFPLGFCESVGGEGLREVEQASSGAKAEVKTGKKASALSLGRGVLKARLDSVYSEIVVKVKAKVAKLRNK